MEKSRGNPRESSYPSLMHPWLACKDQKDPRTLSKNSHVPLSQILSWDTCFFHPKYRVKFKLEVIIIYHVPKSLEIDRKELKVEITLPCPSLRGKAAHQSKYLEVIFWDKVDMPDFSSITPPWRNEE